MDRETNPYSPSELPAERDSAPTPLVGSNPHLRQMFFMQRIALLAVCANVGLILLMRLLPPLPDAVYQLMSTLCLATLCAFWYFVFRAATWNHNVWVGIGHAVLSACLTPCLLVGVFMIPILIRGDAERLADA